MKTSAALTPQIAVIGASLGGVLAAWRAAQAGCTVLLVAEHAWIGGQLTAQGVPPDEHAQIERGGASASYLAFREDMRALYRRQAGFLDSATLIPGANPGTNPGDGWVSRLCFEPVYATRWLETLLWPQVASGRLRLLRGATLHHVKRSSAAATAPLHTAVVRRRCGSLLPVQAQVFVDGTDTGELLAQAALPYRLGKEARTTFGEPDAPLQANPLDQQPVTHVLALRQHTSPGPVIEAPPSYAFWRAHHLPHHQHLLFSGHLPGRGAGTSAWLPFSASGQTLDWWRYRRVVSAAQWAPAQQPQHADVSLVNWAQNDYALHPLLDGPWSQAQVQAAARELSLCLLHWLQTEAPRSDKPDSNRDHGYPEWQPAPDLLGTPDGLAQQVYVRESRRVVARDTLTQLHLQQPPTGRADSVGIGSYNLDIHPTCVSGHGTNASVQPFELPLGTFIPASGVNLVPACKNLGVSHLANACTRVHPVEWLVGEVAGTLAAQFVASGWPDSPQQRQQLQAALQQNGVPRHWPDTLLRLMPATH
jgi:FAD dependent oxidoreductase